MGKRRRTTTKEVSVRTKEALSGVQSKLTLEEYAAFIDNPRRHDITVDQLDQIAFMHGFFKIHKPKLLIMEALESLDLTPPLRSTIGPGAVAKPHTVMPPDLLKRDMLTLGWQECPMGCKLDAPIVADSAPRPRGRPPRTTRLPSPLPSSPLPLPLSFMVSIQRRPRSKRKIASVNVLTAASARPSLPPTPPPLPDESPPASTFFSSVTGNGMVDAGLCV